MSAMKDKIVDVVEDLKGLGVIAALMEKRAALAKLTDDAEQPGNAALWLEHRNVLLGFDYALAVVADTLLIERDELNIQLGVKWGNGAS